MKNSAQIVGLPIISISDGVQIGKVNTLVINPEKGSIDFLTIEQEDAQLSLKAIPFKKVVGIGEFAVTVESENAVIDLAEIPIANQLVNKQIRIKNTKAMTRKGQLLGEVTEFFVDEETGEIIGIELHTNGRQVVLSSEFVLTYGKDILIVNENASSSLLDEASALTQKEDEQEDDIPEKGKEETAVSVDIEHRERLSDMATIEEEAEDDEALQALRKKQIELLQGKRVTKDILDQNGNVLIEAGTILTVEHITKAQEEGPSVIVDVSMNVEA
ncbi:PRC-barrel domain-containing protein [Thermaerobacillus caldiproteolyticus]|uniref:PRC-barrel domain-containing protein n=1 Tax=Thermaerobacillus caldiproteolyticus TaxID=247480 RepID=UPI00188D1862|nr:PRC-barrel domain-containing protein [Anoxybacillus caldiproteolyticus]QPA30243.1 PRC-barrel domain-containing protein [Anoxybacillus caldiproteolyticus]